MKFLILLLFTLYTISALHPFSEEDEYHFKLWMSQFGKVYDIDEYYHRLQIFFENKMRIEYHNKGNHKFTMGLNQFSDLTFDEFKRSFLLTEPQNCSATKGSHVSSNGPYPDSIDWRKKGNYVTDVKNQGPCGSCWTFSTTGCLESVTAIATKKLLQLSEQQLVDCAQAFNNHGCKGGLPSQAFEYIKYNKGLMTEGDYPYTAKDGTCKFKADLAAAFVKDVINITKVSTLMSTIVLSKLEQESDVSFVYVKNCSRKCHPPFHLCYCSKVCHNTTDTVNHAVLAVGYGEDNGTPYWIVKNSWGTNWGMKGYFFIERGKNMCGLAACSSYPLPMV
uniref:Cathepsin H n=1 Tax=Esox lucius TaxID=8010 RepID=A0AAY5KF08_ESOLU